MSIWGYSLKDLLWESSFLLVIPIWMGIAPEWYTWFATKDNLSWVKGLYVLLDGNSLVNIPICFMLICLEVLSLWRMFKDKNFRLYRPVLITICLFLLNYGCNIDYAIIACAVDFKDFLNFLLGIVIVAMIGKLFWVCFNNDCYKKEGKQQQANGFTDDAIEKVEISEELKQYASLIVERLLATNIEKQSYAIGITGEWGVGKTTFLAKLKSDMKDKADVVEFNPWMCRTPEQVTRDFFASLRHQLSPRYSTLSKSIKEYANMVSDIRLIPNSSFQFVIKTLGGEDSLYEKKKSLSEKFSRLPRPIVVTIDDIDRLEREEVFEVLRLIRNTADLSNIIYIVVYDKEYVTSILEERNIKDAATYLEKIFPVEVHLPKVESSQVWETLKSEMRKQDCTNGNFSIRLFDHINNDEREFILRILNSYRRAKRFARLYMLNFNYLHILNPEEIKLLDLFWLELLQVYDKRTYDCLANDPNILLYCSHTRFILLKGILQKADNKEENVYNGETFWKPETPKILDKMFGKAITTREQSICFQENFDKYFALGVPKYKLSKKEFKDLYVGTTNPQNLMENWLDNGKYFSSIAYQLQQQNVSDFQNNQLHNYIYALLRFGLTLAKYNSGYLSGVKNILRADQLDEAKRQIIHDTIMEWMASEKEEDASLLYFGKMLNRFYATIYDDAEGNELPLRPLVISNDEIESLLADAMKNYLDKHPQHTALDVLREKSPLGTLFKFCCVEVKSLQEGSEYKQVAYDSVIAHFSVKEDKPTMDEYNSAYGRMFWKEPPVFNTPEDEYEYWECEEESREEILETYFGSYSGNGDENKLQVFKNSCFVEQ